MEAETSLSIAIPLLGKRSEAFPVFWLDEDEDATTVDLDATDLDAVDLVLDAIFALLPPGPTSSVSRLLFEVEELI